ncbi:MAG: putative metal-dependent hydrolase [Flavobacterium sp.]|nr:putative metal-dependent hydrolase [Flavobacterium sp.]
MTENFNHEKLRFPIGNFNCPESIDAAQINLWISEIKSFPNSISHLTKQLSLTELNWRYRPDGWKIKQVVHHCADSHMNCLIRFKLALTEAIPTIKPYEESKWAALEDGLADDILASLKIIEGVHSKWMILLKSMDKTQFSMQYFHPESQKTFALDEIIGFYAWHCNHHLAHIKQALSHKNQF